MQVLLLKLEFWRFCMLNEAINKNRFNNETVFLCPKGGKIEII